MSEKRGEIFSLLRGRWTEISTPTEEEVKEDIEEEEEEEGGLHRRGEREQQRHRRERELQTSWTVGREERNRWILYSYSIICFDPFLRLLNI